MKKYNILTLGLAMLVMTGCTVTRQEKNPLKEPNGNIRVETATIKKFVPVTYKYQTNKTSCSEVEFLINVTKNDPTINNIYEIHWNQVENHVTFAGLNGEKKYTCVFWGVGIQYGDPLPRTNGNGQTVQNNVSVPAPKKPTPVAETPAPEPAPAEVQAPAEPAVAPAAADTAKVEAKAEKAK